MLPEGKITSNQEIYDALFFSEIDCLCFQHPMEFAETSQYIDYCDSKNQYPPYNTKSGAFAPCSGHGHKIPAKDISVGTVPAGSTWRRNPIPGCKAPNGGAFGESCGTFSGECRCAIKILRLTLLFGPTRYT